MGVEWKQKAYLQSEPGGPATIEALREIAEQLDRLNGNIESLKGEEAEGKYFLRVGANVDVRGRP